MRPDERIVTSRDAAVEMTLAGEALRLLADRAAYWPGASTLLVADPHFGKAAAFRAAGVFVPGGTTVAALERLTALLDATGAARLVFLGDFLHAREGRHPDTMAAIGAWRRGHPGTEMVLVRGNHDRRSGDPPSALGITCVDAPFCDGPFAFVHHPAPVAGRYAIAGHVHPGAVLHGAARQRERAPCFWFGAEVAVMPAFGEFTGLADVRPAPDDRVWVIAEGAVLAVHAPM